MSKVIAAVVVPGILAVVAMLAFLGTYDPWPFALEIAVLAIAAVAAVGYVRVSRRRRGYGR